MATAVSGPTIVNNGAEVKEDPSRPELGRFLIASRSFQAGELILQEKVPLLHLKGGAKSWEVLPPEVLAAASKIRAAELHVPDQHEPIVQDILKKAPNGESADGVFVRCVLHFNSFSAGTSGRDQVVYSLLSRANHDCTPNCSVDADEGALRAIRDIAAGDPLAISYLHEVDLLWRRERRREDLQSRWGFLCTCNRCIAPADDTRRFSSCKTPECTGQLLVEEVFGKKPTMKCTSCNKVVGPETTASLLRLEAAAAKNLEKAEDDELEEEDQGQELMRCFKFASKHPKHTIAVQLAFQHDFPDPYPAQKVVIDGLLTVLGDMASETLVDARRGYAKELSVRGEHKAATEHLEEAARLTCVLDGGSSPAAILRQWEEKEKKGRKKPNQGAPARNFDKLPDLDLGLDPPPKKKAVEAPVVAAPSQQQTASAIPEMDGKPLASAIPEMDGKPPSEVFSPTPSALQAPLPTASSWTPEKPPEKPPLLSPVCMASAAAIGVLVLSFAAIAARRRSAA